MKPAASNLPISKIWHNHLLRAAIGLRQMHPLPATERPSGYRWRSAHWRKAKDLGIKGWRCRRWPEKHISNGSNQMVGICLLKPITSIMLVSRLSKSSTTIEIQFTLALNSTLSKKIAIIQKQTKKIGQPRVEPIRIQLSSVSTWFDWHPTSALLWKS